MLLYSSSERKVFLSPSVSVMCLATFFSMSVVSIVSVDQIKILI